MCRLKAFVATIVGLALLSFPSQGFEIGKLGDQEFTNPCHAVKVGNEFALIAKDWTFLTDGESDEPKFIVMKRRTFENNLEDASMINQLDIEGRLEACNGEEIEHEMAEYKVLNYNYVKSGSGNFLSFEVKLVWADSDLRLEPVISMMAGEFRRERRRDRHHKTKLVLFHFDEGTNRLTEVPITRREQSRYNMGKVTNFIQTKIDEQQEDSVHGLLEKGIPFELIKFDEGTPIAMIN